MKKFVLNTLVLGALCASTASAQGNKDAVVTLRFEQQKLGDVVQYLRDQSGANIVLIDGADLELSLELNNVGWRDGLAIAAEKVECVVVERQGGILSIEKPPRATFIFQNQNIVDVIDAIAKNGSANIVVSPKVQGTISIRLTNVPWRDALDVAVKTLGFIVIEEQRGILRVVDHSDLLAQMETKSYQLRYLRPKGQYKPLIKSEFLQPILLNQQQAKGGADVEKTFTLLKALQKALSKDGQMDFIESMNVIIVRDTAQVHAEIDGMLQRLDVEPSQVYVDVKFVTTLNTDLLDLGVDYGDAGARITATGGAIPISFPFDMGQGGWEDGLIVNPNGGGPFADPLQNAGNTAIPNTVFGALDFTNVQATLKMLQRDTKSTVFQAPKLIVLDGHEGTIFVGETIRYAEAKSEQGQAGGLQLSLSEAEGSPVEVGFQLLIVPHVVPGTTNLTMDVIPKETSLSGTGSSALAPAGFEVFTIGASGLEGSIALPRTRSSTIVTSMMLESGQTAVIGGLTTESDTKTISSVPFISAIPLVGELFKHRDYNRQRRSLLVFLTPSIVHTNADTEAILQRELLRRRQRVSDEMEVLMNERVGPEKKKD